MAFSDPQSIKIGTGTTTLQRISVSGSSSTYQSTDGLIKLTINTTSTSTKLRRYISLQQRAVKPDPLNEQVNKTYVATTSIQLVTAANTAFTSVDLANLILGLTAWSTTDNVTKLVGGEN